MSLPMVISMAVNALYNIVDSYFVAKLSEEAMTALALVYPIQNLITAIGVGIGIGINAGIAYYLGAKKQTTANQIATQGIALSVLHGILLTVLCTAGLWKFLKGFSADLEVNLMAITYGNRVLLFSVVITLGITFEKIFQSVGKMKVSMFSMICGCLINILLDLLMIFGIGPFPAMGIAGAAYATGIGQTATLLIYLIFYFEDPIPVKIQLKYLKPEKQVISRIYAVGITAKLTSSDSTVQQAVKSAVTSFKVLNDDSKKTDSDANSGSSADGSTSSDNAGNSSDSENTGDTASDNTSGESTGDSSGASTDEEYRYFFDANGNMIYAYPSEDGTWRDDNGTSYIFLENGVEDSNGTQYYYFVHK